MSILFYRRPDYVSKTNGPLSQQECQRYVERTANGKRGIPDELSFENIMNNRALPVCLQSLLHFFSCLLCIQPCQLRDFMDYLVYVTHDAENLQFYLWLQDYTERFDALKPDRKTLSPEWKDTEQPVEEKAAQIASPAPAGGKKKRRPGPLMPKVDFDKPAEAAAIGLTEIVVSPTKVDSPIRQDTVSPTRSTFGEIPSFPPVPLSDNAPYGQPILSEESVREMTDEANVQAGLKWQGCK